VAVGTSPTPLNPPKENPRMSSPLAHRLRSAVVAAAAPAAFALAAALGASPVAADVKLPAVLSDSMVLQQGQPVPVWGWADKGEQVTVVFGDQTHVATAGDDGKWSVKLRPLTASDKPAELKVSGKNKLALKDILVGEVWVCSGQSNMEFVVNSAKESKKEIAAADFPTIRLFTVPKTIKLEPQSDTKGNWAACSPKTVGSFSAVGYFFGRELNQKLKVPVGLIHTSWGGTPAEAWTREEDFKKDEALAPIPDGYKRTAQTYEARKANYEKSLAKYKEQEAELKEAAKKAGKPAPQPPRAPGAPDKDPNRPSVLWNGMIAPIVPYAAKGAIWYQGESNAGRAYQYRKLLPTMIDGWRDAWGDADYKFLIVQLANFQAPAKTPGDDDWAELREAQTMTAALKNNGQALAIDLADADNPSDIHPHNKQDVGKRLALVALGKYYGKKDVVYAGPTYSEHKVAGDKVVITLDSAAGLKTMGHEDGGKVTGFQIAGADKKWVWADAVIDGKTVVVSSPEVKEPKAVRYAWSHNPQGNLYNAAGLPAAPFRTDDWPGVTQPKK
jgi:sialate O-acetylesterase